MKFVLTGILLVFCLAAYSQEATIDTVAFFPRTFAEMKKQAIQQQKPYFILFGASWCAPCHRIKTELFIQQELAAFANEHYLVYYLDMESFDGLELNNKFKVVQLPTIKFFDRTGKEKETVIGYFDANYFLNKMKKNVQ